MREYDFKNKDYSVEKFVNDARTDGDTALWVTNNMTDYELIKMFVVEWDRAMWDKAREGKSE